MVGGNLFGLRDRLLGSATPEPRPVATSVFASVDTSAAAPRSALRSQPWWQGVRVLRGRGAQTTAQLPLSPAAIQWRVRWRCAGRRLSVGVPGATRPLVQASCPGEGSAPATDVRRTVLRVQADGAWQLRVDQQVDVPLQQPPLPGMRGPGATRIATGRFERIDQTGQGRLVLYRLADGRRALRLSGFYVSPNVDLELRLSPLPRPRSTREFLSAPSALVAPLPITTGSLNFVLPDDVDPARYRSLVVWCPPQRSAYAAATLVPAS